MVAIVRALSRVPILQSLSQDELEQLAEKATIVTYARGETIVAQDDAGRTFYLILQGRARAIRRGDHTPRLTPLASFGPGDFFGEMALLNDAPRSADVIAAVQTTCALLDWEIFQTEILGNLSVTIALMAGLSRRLRAMDNLLQRTQQVNRRLPHERAQQILDQVKPGMAADIRSALVIKEQNHFTLCDAEGDIPGDNEAGLGLYLGDTRHLSLYTISLGRVRPVVLVSTAQAGYAAEQQLTNDALTVRRRTIHKDTLLISRERIAHAAGFHETITVHNFNPFPVDVEIVLRFAADFADIFEVRGLARRRRGAHCPTEVSAGSVRLCYKGLDERHYTTTLNFDPLPTRLTETMMARRERIAPFGEVGLAVRTVAAVTDGAGALDGQQEEVSDADDQAHATRRSYARWAAATTQVTTDDEVFNGTLARSLADLRLLVNRLGDQQYFAAGVPWYATLFGRDSLITGLQTLAWNPDLAAGILRLLARYQGRRDDSWRDEEPGKILHELRTGELARSGDLPHTPYYGSVDSTPLFLVLLAEYHAWTGDDALVRDLLPQMLAALAWCTEYGNLDGDGYLKYARRSSKGLANQGWKDSQEGIMFRDGRLPESPLALVEVQGYLYAALRGSARLLRGLGPEQAERASDLDKRAAALQERFERDFWLEREQFYALGLDGRKRRIDAITSNPGHALWSGIVSEERAAAVAARLLRDDLFSGWGIRTLGSDNATYNPLGYHLGTVWPHDNALIAAGLKRYGHGRAATAVLTALFEAALQFPYTRLPELFCGIARTPYGVPIGYPVACSPQAWAAGALPFMLTSMLGLRPEDGGRTLMVDQPVLPAWLREVRVRGLRVGQARLDLTFLREGSEESPATMVVEHQEGAEPVEVRLVAASP